MMLLNVFLIIGTLCFSISATSGLPNIVFILMDDVDVDLTGLKVWCTQNLRTLPESEFYARH